MIERLHISRKDSLFIYFCFYILSGLYQHTLWLKITLNQMGMIAEYLMVDENTLNSLMNLSSDELTTKVIEITETGTFERIDIDKIWDALHCFLTGVSANQPIEDDRLSEAIVGIHNFNIVDDDADFITCTENEELYAIIKAIESVDFKKLADNFDPSVLKKNKVYPNRIWEDDKAQLVSEMKQALDLLLDFYKKALATDHHVIISIL